MSAGTPSPPPRTALRALAIAIGLAATIFLLETLPLLPGPDLLKWPALAVAIVGPFLSLLALAGFGLLYYIPYLIFSRDRRAWAARQSLLCIALFLGSLAGVAGTFQVRRARFAAAADRATPLIQAIEAHRKAAGALPATLESLVPSHLREIPLTGMMAYPSFYYRTPKPDDRFKTYELIIPCARGMSFDQFVYWPEQGYPNSMYGGGVERIKDWAYVHE